MSINKKIEREKNQVDGQPNRLLFPELKLILNIDNDCFKSKDGAAKQNFNFRFLNNETTNEQRSNFNLQ